MQVPQIFSSVGNFYHSISLGVRRQPGKFIAACFLAYSALWTMIESSAAFVDEAKLSGGKYYLALVLTSVLIGFCIAARPRSTIIKIPNSNTRIRIFFGDIFEQDGILAVPVNDFFDSEIGLPVSPRSLHGMVINRSFGGQAIGFDLEVAREVVGLPNVHNHRARGKEHRYDVGTAITVSTSAHRFLLFVLGTTDIATFKVSVNLEDYVRAICGLCRKARNILGGDRLVLPLVGSGVSGVGMPSQQLLAMIILVLMSETKRGHIANDIDIVLHVERFEEIDLSAIEEIISA